jgi:hypothetical protein
VKEFVLLGRPELRARMTAEDACLATSLVSHINSPSTSLHLVVKHFKCRRT